MIWKDGEVVGHVPKSLRKITSFSLNYHGNMIFCEVTGQRLNRVVRLGIEVPCVYRFYGHQSHINILEELLRKQ